MVQDGTEEVDQLIKSARNGRHNMLLLALRIEMISRLTSALAFANLIPTPSPLQSTNLTTALA